MTGARIIGFAGLIIGSLLIISCENDLNEVNSLSSTKNQVIVDKSYGVEMIFSDSNIVKNKFITPEAFHYNAKDPYWEMKKGVTIIFYDNFQKQMGTITADYAIWRELKKTVTLQKNVLITTVKGETVKSDEIVWDQNTHQFRSDKMVTYAAPSPNGPPTILYGDGFTSDENLKFPNLIRARGNINVPEQQAF